MPCSQGLRGEDVEAAKKAEEIDLAVVDLLLPDGVGTELIGELHADGWEVRVLTAARGPNLRAVCP